MLRNHCGSRMLRDIQRYIQVFVRKAVENEWGVYAGEEAALQPLIYSTPSERVDYAMALNVYAVGVLMMGQLAAGLTVESRPSR